MNHDWTQRLPHGPEFRFVSDVRQIEHGLRGTGAWEVRADAPFLRGHFPERPIVPGVLLVEALAQLTGLVAWAQADDAPTAGALAQVEVRFGVALAPPVTVELRCEVTRVMGRLVQAGVWAGVGDAFACRGHLVLAAGQP